MGKIHEFEFCKVFDQYTNQNDIFCETVKSKIPSLLNGISNTIFAYGQTGSGKTYTLFGDENNSSYNENIESHGIIYRSVEHLFKIISQVENETNDKIKVKVSTFEIYNEQIFDLLTNNNIENDKSLIPCEDPTTSRYKK